MEAWEKEVVHLALVSGRARIEARQTVGERGTAVTVVGFLGTLMQAVSGRAPLLAGGQGRGGLARKNGSGDRAVWERG